MFHPTAGPGPLSYQGVYFPSCGLKLTLMTGHCDLNGAPPRGQWRVGEWELSLMMGRAALVEIRVLDGSTLME